MNTTKRIAVITALTMVFTMSTAAAAFAADGDEYLALGANLSDEQKATVLELLGVEDTNDYNIIYVTNAEEHQYLDGYVDSGQIGSAALSSVLVKENGGSEINVETHNIGYCTEGMYRNALSTAGVNGADVVVAGPFEISGTAALVGTIKAYEQMTGETVDDEVIEASVDEITTTGELGEEIGSKEDAEGIISQIKEELADNPDMSESEIEESIKEAAEEAGYDISEEAVESVENMAENFQNIDIDWDNVQNVFDSVDVDGLLDRIINWFKSLIG